MAKFWELFKKFEEAPSPEQAAEAVSEFRQVRPGLDSSSRQDLQNWGLRLGMWVSTPEGVGIVTGTYQDTVEVMLTDDAGFNKKKQNFTAGAVQQAKWAQIPKARRPETAHSGY